MAADTSRQLHLHIGSHKTGTTAIQKACRFHLAGSGAQRVHYFNIRPSGRRILKSRGKLERFHAEIDLQAASEIFLPEAGQGASRFLASDEEFFWISDPDAVSGLAALLRERFDEIRIICYLRRQDRLAISHRKQVVGGAPATRFYGISPTPLPEYQPHFDRYFDYASKLSDIWAANFGKDNITVVPYEDRHLHEANVVKDFERRLKLRFSEIPPRGINSSLPADRAYAGLWLAKMNCPAPQRKEIMQTLPGEGRFLPTRDEAKRFLAHFEESNARLSKEWRINGRPFAFDHGFDMYPETETEAGISIRQANNILEALLPYRQIPTEETGPRRNPAHQGK